MNLSNTIPWFENSGTIDKLQSFWKHSRTHEAKTNTGRLCQFEIGLIRFEKKCYGTIKILKEVTPKCVFAATKKKIIGQSKWSKNENLQKCCTWMKSKRKRRYVKQEAENHHAVPLKIIYLIYLIYLFFWASGIPTMSNTDQYVNTSKAKKFTCENFQYQLAIQTN